MFIEKDQMEAHEYIKQTRAYLDYLEEHIENIRKAFQEVSLACDGMAWVGDDRTWFDTRHEITLHDVSKFSKEEFTQYRGKFFSTKAELHDTQELDMNFDKAWTNHQAKNHHHWETAETETDIIHLVVDWTAMGYKFGDTAEEYYQNNIHDINIPKQHQKFLQTLFKKIKEAL